MNNIILNTATVVVPPEESELDYDDLKIFSTVSEFSDNIWVIDLRSKRRRDSLYFSGIPVKFRDIVKEYSLLRLMHLKAAKTVATNITNIRSFLVWLIKRYPDYSLKHVTRKTIDEYQVFLERNDSISKSHKENIWGSIKNFFKMMQNRSDFPDRILMKKGNPFSRTIEDRKKAEKYIPEDVATQFDAIFKNEQIPLHIKVCYWICRLIPSRIGEIIPLPIDCLREYEEDYILTLYMYKQNGGYYEPEKRMIRIKYSDMGKYLVDLIMQQQKEALKLQDYCQEEKKDRLLISHRIIRYRGENGNILYKNGKNLFALTEGNFRKWLTKCAEDYSITDENGQPFRLTSHQFRHNAITDRIYENFNLLEIKDMTHHKTTAMIEQSYVHAKEPELQKMANAISSDEEKAFPGRIITKAIRFERILKMPRAQRIGNMGVCSDSSGCSSDMYDCLVCSYFVPCIEDLEEFVKQKEKLEEQIVLYKEKPFMREKLEVKISSLEIIIKRITDMMEEEDGKGYPEGSSETSG